MCSPGEMPGLVIDCGLTCISGSVWSSGFKRWNEKTIRDKSEVRILKVIITPSWHSDVIKRNRRAFSRHERISLVLLTTTKNIRRVQLNLKQMNNIVQEIPWTELSYFQINHLFSFPMNWTRNKSYNRIIELSSDISKILIATALKIEIQSYQ
jgi:hypothetical protein